MSTTNFFILDVGHGNCSILQDGHKVAIFDAGRGSSLLEFVSANNISILEYVVLSHSDADHIGGLIALLSAKKITIGAIYLNPDSSKKSAIWKDLLIAIQDARDSGVLSKFWTCLTPELDKSLDLENVGVRVVAPRPLLAALGSGQSDEQGRLMSSNSLSAVIRLEFLHQFVAVLAGDIDTVGFDNIERHDDFQSDLLIYPHHGGLPGTSDVKDFVDKLLSASQCGTIIFSIRENPNRFPRREVLQQIHIADPKTQIISTQRSEVLAHHIVENELISSDHINGSGEIKYTFDKEGFSVQTEHL